MNLKIKLTLIIILMINITVLAQSSFTLKGKVVSQEDKLPVPGVNILIKNSTKGTSTDFDGNYALEVTSGDVLEFSFLGFVTKSITITNQTVLNVALAPDTAALDEVVVIGYGKQKKSHLTGAISKVVNDDLDQIAVSRADEALAGQISGVSIQATNPEAGADPTIRIRGVGSISASSNPLLVIDGVAVSIDFFSSINMNDVASMEVLKDAASSAIYGSRGANGVVMITTKQGKVGKTKFSYNGFFGTKWVPLNKNYNISVKDHTAWELGQLGELTDKTIYKNLIGVDNNWQDIIFDGGNIQNHNISARGGTKNTRFFASVGVVDDQGVLLTDNFEKYNMKLKIDTKVGKKFSFGANIDPSYTKRRRFDGHTYDILRQTSWLPIYHDENTIQFVDRNLYPDVQIGDYAVQRHFDNYDLYGDGGQVDISSTSGTNPYAKVAERKYYYYQFKLFGSVYGEYKITNNLSFKTLGAATMRNKRTTRWGGALSHRSGAAVSFSQNQDTESIQLVSDNIFTYDKTWGKHELNAVAGISAEKFRSDYAYIKGTGYQFDYIETINAASLISDAYTTAYETSLLSYLGRANYAYNDKYLASVSLRRDGSSVFGGDSKYGNFPAISLGWRLSQEDWLKNSEIVSNLKFRFSYGQTGNNSIDPYQYLALLESTSAIVDGGVATGFNPENIANPGLKWEKSEEMNPGIDFGFLNGKITGSLDYYNRKSVDLLLEQDIPSSTGFSYTQVNIGEVENSGIEFELRTRNIAKNDFSWNSTVLLSHNKNTLLDFADANGLISSVDSKRPAEWINLVGHPISSFYGYVMDRDIPLEYINNPYAIIGAQAQDVYVKDLNGDGLIDDDDKTILGDPYPELVWSFSNDFTFRNFDLSFMFQGSHGAEIRNIGEQYYFNQFTSNEDYIKSTTPDQGFIREKIFTNDIIQDASYIALRTVNIGYQFPDSFNKLIGLSKGRFYVSGHNLLYFMHNDYSGFNPEAIYPTSPTTHGYQRGGAPIAKTVSIGLNLEF